MSSVVSSERLAFPSFSYPQKLSSTERLVKLASPGNIELARGEAMMKPTRWHISSGRLIFEAGCSTPMLTTVAASTSVLPAHLAKLVESTHRSLASENADVQRECATLRSRVHAGIISVEHYLGAVGGFVTIGKGSTTTPAEAPVEAEGELPVSGRVDGPGSLPPIVFTTDDAVVLADGMTVSEKVVDNSRRLAAVELRRLTMGNVERPAIDSLLDSGELSRKALKFTQTYEDSRISAQLTRQPDIFKPKVVVCLGGSKHDETTHEGCLRVFLSCLEETGVQSSKIALAVFMGSDALCHLVCGDQKTIGGLFVIMRKVAAKIKALADSGANRTSPQLSALCRWWTQLRACIPKAGDFHVRIHILDIVVACTGPLILHPIRHGCIELPALPDKFNVKQFNHWDKQARIFYEVIMEAAVYAFLKSQQCHAVVNEPRQEREVDQEEAGRLPQPQGQDREQQKALRLADAFVGFLDGCENGDDITAKMSAVALKLLSAYKARLGRSSSLSSDKALPVSYCVAGFLL